MDDRVWVLLWSSSDRPHPASIDGRPVAVYPERAPGLVEMTVAEARQRTTDTQAAFDAWEQSQARPVNVEPTVLVAVDGSAWVVGAAGSLVRR